MSDYTFGNAGDAGLSDMLPSDEDLQAAEEARLQAIEEAYAKAKRIAACFNTPDGQFVLDWMNEMFVNGPRFDARGTDAALMAAQGFFREGQAAIYREILIQIRRAEEGPATIAQPKRKGRRK